MSPIYWSWKCWQRSLRYMWQNITRGWNDSDIWGLDYVFAKFISPRLKRFKEISRLQFGELTFGGLGVEKRDEALDKMIKAFDLVIKHEYESIEAEDHEAIKEGLKLFAKYYQFLWD